VVNEQIFARYVKGETVKNDHFIYTQYYKNGAKCETPTGAMLYDHANDPEENINLVDAPEHRETVNELKALLATHMQTRFELKQN
jgi:arylsulfatase A-like enzyme